jgi:hypothetical protein
VIQEIQNADGWAIVVDSVEQLEEFITTIKIFQILENANAQVDTPQT